jgi:hypothetical protein
MFFLFSFIYFAFIRNIIALQLLFKKKKKKHNKLPNDNNERKNNNKIKATITILN